MDRPSRDAQLAVVREQRAHQAAQRGEEEAAFHAEAQQRGGVRDGAHIGGNDVAEDEPPARLQLGAEHGEPAPELLAGQILQERIDDHEIERAVGQRLHVLGREHRDDGVARIARLDARANGGGGVREVKRAAFLGDLAGLAGLAAAEIEHHGLA